ncbi:hypothetical protein ACFH04_07500 [Streptomyces noboritoensis]|uniref:Lipoprotein n=1 Tax=Streptomyces noboritoensis TaxID=67337 RepID=A0ABV6TEL4_9ACTN
MADEAGTEAGGAGAAAVTVTVAVGCGRGFASSCVFSWLEPATTRTTNQIEARTTVTALPTLPSRP